MIHTAIRRAYNVANDRNWDRIYWAIDLHGVCLKSNYVTGEYEFINDACIRALQLISSGPESCIILWSSCYDDEKADIIKFFHNHHILVSYFNENPEVDNGDVGCFEQKFYFSILLDDKSGFDPDIDWEMVHDVVKAMHLQHIQTEPYKHPYLIGSRVRLKSGGPKMTVVGWDALQRMKVSWLDDEGTQQLAHFIPRDLTYWTEDSPSKQ